MRSRRLTFAAPFVIVVACKRPVADVDEPVADEIVVDGQRVTPDVATRPDAAAVDARPIDAPPDASVWSMVPPEPRKCGTKGYHCNPPPPHEDESLRKRPKITKAISSKIDKNGSMTLVVAAGSDDGIDARWRACVLDGHDRCVETSPLRILDVSRRTTTVFLQSAVEIVARPVRVQLSPP